LAGIFALNESNFSNNFDSYAATTVAPHFDIGIDVSHSGNVVIGEQTVYNVYLENEGNSSMSGVVMTHTLPTGVTFVSAVNANTGQSMTPTAISSSGGRQVLHWEMGTVPAYPQSGYYVPMNITVAVAGSV